MKKDEPFDFGDAASPKLGVKVGPAVEGEENENGVAADEVEGFSKTLSDVRDGSRNTGALVVYFTSSLVPMSVAFDVAVKLNGESGGVDALVVLRKSNRGVFDVYSCDFEAFWEGKLPEMSPNDEGLPNVNPVPGLENG